MPESRNFPRFATSIRASLSGLASKGKIVSLSAGGCAIRTSERLKKNGSYIIKIPNLLEEPVEIVWEANDYEIDTLYRYGLRFLKPLPPPHIDGLLKVIA